jgi:hypothetical protein
MRQEWGKILAVLSDAEAQRRGLTDITNETIQAITSTGMPWVLELDENLSGDELIDALNQIVVEAFNIVLGTYTILPTHPDLV